MKFYSKFIHFHSRKSIWKRRLENGRDFVLASMCIIVPLSPSGRYSCVYAEFVFHRKFGYYLIQIYVPSVLVVLLSWVSFWLDASSVPARVSLGLLTILTMTSQMSGASASLPKVHMDHSLSNYWPFARRIYRSSVDSPSQKGAYSCTTAFQSWRNEYVRNNSEKI